MSRVGPEWGIVFSLGIIGVTEARLCKAGFRVEEVVNLAYALWCCRAHPNIDVLFAKLQSDHIRGALLEIRIATNLIRHGYHVELDKNLNVRTRSTDVFLQIGTYNWLIECKRPRLNFQKHFDRFNILQRRLQALLRGAVPPWLTTKELRVDILLQRRINDRESKKLVGAVKRLSEEHLCAHIEREGYWSLSIQPQASPPTFDTPFASETTVEKTGIRYEWTVVPSALTMNLVGEN